MPLPGTDYLVTNPSLSRENLHPGGTSFVPVRPWNNQLLRDFFALLRPLAGQAGDEELVAKLDAASHGSRPTV